MARDVGVAVEDEVADAVPVADALVDEVALAVDVLVPVLLAVGLRVEDDTRAVADAMPVAVVLPDAVALAVALADALALAVLLAVALAEAVAVSVGSGVAGQLGGAGVAVLAGHTAESRGGCVAAGEGCSGAAVPPGQWSPRGHAVPLPHRDPGAQKAPGGAVHGAHAVAPGAAVKKPTLHGVHCAAPGAGDANPASHSALSPPRHADPAAHGTPPGAEDPAAHANPAGASPAQLVQSCGELAPAKAHQVPIGHGVHASEPSWEYVPGVQRVATPPRQLKPPGHVSFKVAPLGAMRV